MMANHSVEILRLSEGLLYSSSLSEPALWRKTRDKVFGVSVDRAPCNLAESFETLGANRVTALVIVPAIDQALIHISPLNQPKPAYSSSFHNGWPHALVHSSKLLIYVCSSLSVG